ncbi:MAG: flippase-like domain-containing protein [Candidatus Cloacimonetes bacterium]|nr:flippase-like domain-containing protein [Candidatus Cloacimonadota bacterium]
MKKWVWFFSSDLSKIIFGLLVGIVFVLIWLNIIDMREIIGYISEINIYFLIPATIFYLLSYFFRSLRLRKLLLCRDNLSNQNNDVKSEDKNLCQKLSIPIFKNYTYVLAGNFINYLIPIRAGEIAKSVFYKKNHNIRYSDSLPSIFIDKLLDTFVIFLVLLLIPFTKIVFTPTLNILIILLIIVFLIGISILTLAALSQQIIIKTLKKIFFFLPLKYKTKIHNFFELFVKGLAIFKHHKTLFIPCVVLTFVATFSDSFFFYMMFIAFNVSVSFTQILFGYTLIFLSYILPHPPAQIGSNELLMVLIFSVGFGFSENLISAIMSLSHLLTAVVIFITGSLSLVYAGNKLMDIFNKKEKLYG